MGRSMSPIDFIRFLPSFCFSSSFRFPRDVPAVALRNHVLPGIDRTIRSAAITFCPMAACNRSSNICRGMISFSFSTICFPRSYALSRCVMNKSAVHHFSL